MDEGELRTRFAMQAADFSAAFRSVVGHLRLPPGGYVAELMAPEGPSTRGGRQALQRIRLVPASHRFPTLVVGSANVKSGRGHLRSFAYVDAIHQEHFGRPVDLDRGAYEEFIELVQNYFKVAQLDVEIEEPPEATITNLRRRRSASPIAVGFVAVAGLSAVLAMVYYIVH
jgi:hypothetical protein